MAGPDSLIRGGHTRAWEWPRLPPGESSSTSLVGRVWVQTTAAVLTWALVPKGEAFLLREITNVYTYRLLPGQSTEAAAAEEETSFKNSPTSPSGEMKESKTRLYFPPPQAPCSSPSLMLTLLMTVSWASLLQDAESSAGPVLRVWKQRLEQSPHCGWESSA